LPRDLSPPWTVLPRLSWLIVRRLPPLQTRSHAVNRLLAATFAPLMLAILAASRADGAVAAHRSEAVLITTGIYPRPRARFHLAMVAALTAYVLATSASLLCVSALVGLLPGPSADAATYYSGLLVQAGLIVAGAAGYARYLGPTNRRALTRRARRLAHDHGYVLILAHTLAAASDGARSTTTLVRRLLRFADEHHIAVLAQPRDAVLGRRYQRFGFAPLDANRERMLLRLPD
jgi:hypothetical protein